MITVNGSTRKMPESPSLAGFLRAEGYSLDRIVVEINRAIVPKKDYESVGIKEGDSLEILNFVSGG